jgi:hypothetical protein
MGPAMSVQRHRSILWCVDSRRSATIVTGKLASLTVPHRVLFF